MYVMHLSLRCGVWLDYSITQTVSLSTGLKDYQDAYRPYPNALLSLRFVIEVGKIVLSDLDLVTAQVKEEEQSSSDQPDQENESKPKTVQKGRPEKLSASSTRKVTTPKSLASSSRVTRFSFHSRPDSTTWDSKVSYL